jgi:phosphatidylserine synthase
MTRGPVHDVHASHLLTYGSLVHIGSELDSLVDALVYNVEENNAVFVGMPTTAAGLIWSTCLLWPLPPLMIASLFLVVGIGMVCPVSFGRPRSAGLAVFILWAAALVTVHSLRWVF